jgi:hypothetical protein
VPADIPVIESAEEADEEVSDAIGVEDDGDRRSEVPRKTKPKRKRRERQGARPPICRQGKERDPLDFVGALFSYWKLRGLRLILGGIIACIMGGCSGFYEWFRYGNIAILVAGLLLGGGMILLGFIYFLYFKDDLH